MKKHTIKLTTDEIKHIYEALAFSSTVDVCANWPEGSGDDTEKLNVMLNINDQIDNKVDLEKSNIYIYMDRPDLWENKEINDVLIEKFKVVIKDE